jgi:TonB family protein
MFIHCETQPEFPGGMEALMDYLKANIRYPQEAKERGKQGRVIVQFIVEEDGTLTEGKVMKPVDPQLDAEAIRIMRSMPKWKPGETRGKPTRMRFTFPVSFRLKD